MLLRVQLTIICTEKKYIQLQINLDFTCFVDQISIRFWWLCCRQMKGLLAIEIDSRSILNEPSHSISFNITGIQITSVAGKLSLPMASGSSCIWGIKLTVCKSLNCPIIWRHEINWKLKNHAIVSGKHIIPSPCREVKKIFSLKLFVEV